MQTSLSTPHQNTRSLRTKGLLALFCLISAFSVGCAPFLGFGSEDSDVSPLVEPGALVQGSMVGFRAYTSHCLQVILSTKCESKENTMEISWSPKNMVKELRQRKVGERVYRLFLVQQEGEVSFRVKSLGKERTYTYTAKKPQTLTLQRPYEFGCVESKEGTYLLPPVNESLQLDVKYSSQSGKTLAYLGAYPFKVEAKWKGEQEREVIQPEWELELSGWHLKLPWDRLERLVLTDPLTNKERTLIILDPSKADHLEVVKISKPSSSVEEFNIYLAQGKHRFCRMLGSTHLDDFTLENLTPERCSLFQANAIIRLSPLHGREGYKTCRIKVSTQGLETTLETNWND